LTNKVKKVCRHEERGKYEIEKRGESNERRTVTKMDMRTRNSLELSLCSASGAFESVPWISDATYNVIDKYNASNCEAGRRQRV
jgi:hypothetical protein